MDKNDAPHFLWGLIFSFYPYDLIPILRGSIQGKGIDLALFGKDLSCD
jgi:hypothetical protein